MYKRFVGSLQRLLSIAIIVFLAACSSEMSTMNRGLGASGNQVQGIGDGTGNSAQVVQSDAASPPGTTLVAAPNLGPGPSAEPLENCDPGSYAGTYECYLVMQGEPTDTKIEGVVAFDLEINEVTMTQAACPPGQEFCDFDLVISEGSGELFGFVLGVVGFETGLEGGLDCSTGEFHAKAVGGIYGIPWPDPDDPDGKLKVTVELGTFDGTLDGYHNGKMPEVIAGEWNLGEPSFDIYCPGPFSVQLGS